MSYSALSDSFEYLFYGSTANRNIFFSYSVGVSESDVYRRQIPTTKVNPRAVRFKPSPYIKASFYIPENRLHFPTTKGFRTKISMKLVYQYMAIFFNF